MDCTVVKVEAETDELNNLITIKRKKLATWTVFRILNDPEIYKKVERAYIIGPLMAILVTAKDEVLVVWPPQVGETEKLVVIKISALCDKEIVELYSYQSEYFAALSKDGKLYAWGINEDGRLGIGDGADEQVNHRKKPSKVMDLRDEIDEIDLNKGNTSGDDKTDEDDVEEDDESGEDDETSVLEPSLVRGLESVKVISVGCSSKFMLVMSREGVYISGRLELTKNGKSFDYLTKVMERAILFNGIDVIGISVGKNAFAAYSQEGDVIFWKLNNKTAQQKRFSFRFKKVVCGNSHFLGLSKKDNVYAWGNNSFGQLGNGDRKSTNEPIRVTIPEPVQDICAHPDHNLSVCMTSSGRVYIWGILVITGPTLTNFENVIEPFKKLYNTYVSTMVVEQEEIVAATPKDILVASVANDIKGQVTVDVFFKIRTRIVAGHRDILARRSPHLKAIFAAHEDKEGNITEPIVMADVLLATFEAYIFLVYTGRLKCTEHNVEYIMDLLRLCKSYKEEEFTTICEEGLKSALTVGTAINLFTLVASYNSRFQIDEQLETLEAHVLDFIVAHKKELSTEIQNLPGNMEPVILKKILASLTN